MSEASYLNLLEKTLKHGQLVNNRTGIKAYTYPHDMLKFDMSNGFPLITTKKMAWNSIRVELEFFIKGLTDKQWLKDRGCKIWNEWCNPKKIPLDVEDKKEFQFNENDLGPIYGYQWRNFNGSGFDQLKYIIDQLKTNPDNRQLVCSAWNPLQLGEMALPPCHFSWHVFRINDQLHLSWNQRSCDLFLGVPFNIASYALLLHLICLETGYKEGTLTGFLSNCHIYENHVNAVKTQLNRVPFKSPIIKTDNFKSIFDWSWDDTKLENYNFHDPIKAEIAI